MIVFQRFFYVLRIGARSVAPNIFGGVAVGMHCPNKRPAAGPHHTQGARAVFLQLILFIINVRREGHQSDRLLALLRTHFLLLREGFSGPKRFLSVS